VCGSRMEELTLILLILGTGFSAVLTAIWYKKGQNPAKKAKKSAEISMFDNLIEYREVEKGTIADILHQKDAQIKSLNARIKLLEPELEPESPTTGVKWEEIQLLVKQSYPQYALALPMFKGQIMKAVKGMTLNEVITNVQSIIKGSGKSPIGTDALDTNGNNPNWA